MTLHQSDICEKNEDQNIEECSKVKLQTTTVHSAYCTSQAHFFQPKPISFGPNKSPNISGPFFFLFFSSAPSPITHLHAFTSHLLTFYTQAIHPSPIFLPYYQPPLLPASPTCSHFTPKPFHPSHPSFFSHATSPNCQPLPAITLPPATSPLSHHH